jgi:hypothetical protein
MNSAFHYSAYRSFDSLAKKRIALAATRNSVPIIPNRGAIWKYDLAGKEIQFTQNPLGDHVFVVEFLLARVGAAKETAIAFAYVSPKPIDAEV